MKNLKYLIYIIPFIFWNCTDLEEEINSELTSEEARENLLENVDFSSLLERVYRDFDSRFIQHEGSVWLLNEVSADHAVVPSRPSGWDNGGLFRQLHTHNFQPQNRYINSVWDGMNQAVFDATNILQFNPDEETEAEARFLRAYFMATTLDLFNQVPFREPGDNLLEPSRVIKGTEAADFIIQELEEVLPFLPDNQSAYLASKNAARGLLARVYLNRGVYENRENPQFENADLQKVIEYVDAIEGKEIDFYWDSFGPDNNSASSELIFSIEGEGGVRSHSLWVWWHAIFPTEISLPNGGGWNGYSSTPELYDLFEESDIRRYYEHPITEPRGYNVGFLAGQQYDADGEPLPEVNFTKEVPTLTGASLWNGYRPVKYVPDYENPGAADNDIVLLRYADLLLMKAEALLRLGNEAQALSIVNEIRENRNVDPLTELNLDNLLEERGRELFWEGHRRQDLIRYGKFLGEWTLKETSSPQYLIYPIPPEDVLANDNLEQNPGY